MLILEYAFFVYLSVTFQNCYEIFQGDFPLTLQGSLQFMVAFALINYMYEY